MAGRIIIIIIFTFHTIVWIQTSPPCSLCVSALYLLYNYHEGDTWVRMPLGLHWSWLGWNVCLLHCMKEVAMMLNHLVMCYCSQMAHYFPSVPSWTWCWFSSTEPWMAISPPKAKSSLWLTNYKNLASSQYILTWLTRTARFVCSSGTIPCSLWWIWAAWLPVLCHSV